MDRGLVRVSATARPLPEAGLAVGQPPQFAKLGEGSIERSRPWRGLLLPPILNLLTTLTLTLSMSLSMRLGMSLSFIPLAVHLEAHRVLGPHRDKDISGFTPVVHDIVPEALVGLIGRH